MIRFTSTIPGARRCRCPASSQSGMPPRGVTCSLSGESRTVRLGTRRKRVSVPWAGSYCQICPQTALPTLVGQAEDGGLAARARAPTRPGWRSPSLPARPRIAAQRAMGALLGPARAAAAARPPARRPGRGPAVARAVLRARPGRWTGSSVELSALARRRQHRCMRRCSRRPVAELTDAQVTTFRRSPAGSPTTEVRSGVVPFRPWMPRARATRTRTTRSPRRP